MEIYSTVLWHMRSEVELSYLAHEMTEIDRLSPQAWCVLGNCFSLQKEHDTAIKFFQRVGIFSVAMVTYIGAASRSRLYVCIHTLWARICFFR